MENNTITMTYEDYKTNREAAFKALPIFFAFTTEQLKNEMEKRGLTIEDTDKIYRFSGNGFYLRSDADIIKAFCSKPDPLPELMKDFDFAVSAFYYEMCNHEYGINYYQGNWDVLSCFYKVEYNEDDDFDVYADALQLSAETRRAYRAARKKYYKAAEENEWF